MLFRSACAFSNCNGLTSLDLNKVTDIGYGAFMNCKKITTAIFNNVNYISNNAFSDCYDLASIFISNNLGYIGKSAFESCVFLDTINFQGTKYEWTNRIAKDYCWNNAVYEYKVICTDGELEEYGDLVVN